MTHLLTISPTLARQLNLTQQHLAGPTPDPTPAALLEVTRDLGCLQLDPLSVVARSHLLVMFSRLGPYAPQHFNQLLFEERTLFEYWAHCASIVLTEDYPIHHVRMRAYLSRPTAGSQRERDWLEQNKKLKKHILTQLRRRGPLLSRDLESISPEAQDWVSTGWTSGRNVSQMLDHLWLSGQIMVTGRQGIQKVWDLTERCLPAWTPREKLSEDEMTRRAALKSLRALGVATRQHIGFHFIRGRYRGLPQALAELEAEGQVQRVEIRDGRQSWPGAWYIAREAAPALERLAAGNWLPRTTLLSPFDNLICNRARTQQFFNFDFRVEIYTPEAKRKYGYYVLPILHEDRLIGRVDPKMDRVRGVLTVNAIHAEPRAPKAGRAVATAIESLAAFLGAREINYNKQRLPSIWKRELLA